MHRHVTHARLPPPATSRRPPGSPRHVVHDARPCTPAPPAPPPASSYPLRKWAPSAARPAPQSPGSPAATPPRSSTGAAPGRVDSPPTSMMSTPSSATSAPRRGRRPPPVPPPAVGKRVGRHIQHAHHQPAPGAENKFKLPRAKSWLHFSNVSIPDLFHRFGRRAEHFPICHSIILMSAARSASPSPPAPFPIRVSARTFTV